MSKISEVFKNSKALITYVTAGDPNLEVTKEIILELNKDGVDIIEVGIPFRSFSRWTNNSKSKPKSFKNGVTLKKF